jgi:hypothetical protein
MARIRRGEIVHCSGFRATITEWLLGARVPGVTRARVLPLRCEVTVGQRCWVAGRVGEACGVCVAPSGARKCPALGRSVLWLVGLDYQLDTFSIRTRRTGKPDQNLSQRCSTQNSFLSHFHCTLSVCKSVVSLWGFSAK